MTHSLNKEASQLLRDVVRCRVEDGDATAENWTDSKGEALVPDRIWNDGTESMIAGLCVLNPCDSLSQFINEVQRNGKSTSSAVPTVSTL
jgi:hypothetical protein